MKHSNLNLTQDDSLNLQFENDNQNLAESKLAEKLFELSKNDFNLALLPYLADILTDNVLSDKVRSLRLEAWYGLKMGLTKLLNDGISMLHLSGIAKKKGTLIMKNNNAAGT